MLGCPCVSYRQCPIRVVHHDAGRLAGQRGGHPLGVPGLRHRLRQLDVHPVGQRAAGGDQQAGCQLVVLGLGDEVCSDETGVGPVVSDYGDLGRPGLGVDRHSLPEQPLCRGHVHIAGPADHVDRRTVLGTVAEYGDGLSAARSVHLGDAKQRARGQDRRVRQAAMLGLWRRRDHDLADSGHLRGNDVHQHRGRISNQSARHVYAGPAHRQVPFGNGGSGSHGGPGLSRQVGVVHKRGPPGRFSQSGQNVSIQPLEGGGQCLRRYRGRRHVYAVEPGGVIPDRSGSAHPDVLADRPHPVNCGADIQRGAGQQGGQVRRAHPARRPSAKIDPI